MTVDDFIKALQVRNVSNYRVQLLGSLTGNHGIILSVYPDHKENVMYIDVADVDDDTV
jgi:hypothetical protein